MRPPIQTSSSAIASFRRATHSQPGASPRSEPRVCLSLLNRVQCRMQSIHSMMQYAAMQRLPHTKLPGVRYTCGLYDGVVCRATELEQDEVNPMSATVEAVRGMRDVLPNEQRELARLRATINEVMVRYGYETLDLPIVEHRDLYQRKLGEELVGKLYEFNMGGRDLSLRPEWTASVLRAYVTHMQDLPLPLRLSYCGPVFRYERPQRFTYRQFTQMGVELIGGPLPRADAEVLSLACAGLDAAGVQNYHVVIGHIGLVRQILTHMGLAERTQGLLIWGMERIRTHGIAAMRQRLSEMQGELPIDPALLTGLDDDQVRNLLLHLLDTMKVNLSFGTRPPEAIVNRLVRKLHRDDPQPRIEHALNVLDQLSQIRGTPAASLSRAMHLLNAADLPTAALVELRALLTLLEAHSISQERLILDFGMGRGLHYYTGPIFEIYDSSENQLCGGGRYDELVQALGGRQRVPAIGFSYGLERVAAAIQPASATSELLHSVLVVPVEDDDYLYALYIAHRLRSSGFIVTVDVRGRGVVNNLRDADRRGIPYVAIVGSAERAHNQVRWRTLATRDEHSLNIEELPGIVENPPF